MEDEFYTLKSRSEALYKDRGSKFIGIALPFSDADDLQKELDEIRSAYKNATHYCYAYLINPEHEQFRINDDGEPSGTAGLPILGQIRSHELINVMVVVVRYYGGVKLGTSGLKSAYKETANQALLAGNRVLRKITSKFRVTFNYEDTSMVKSDLTQFGAEIVDEKYDAKCHLTFLVNKKLGEATKLNFMNKRNLVIDSLD